MFSLVNTREVFVKTKNYMRIPEDYFGSFSAHRMTI